MKNKNIGYFATTVKPNGIWEYLAYSSKINAEKKLNKKLNLIKIKKKRLSINLIFFVLKYVIILNIFFFKKYINLKYKNYDIGVFAASFTFGTMSVYNSKIQSYYNIFKNIFIAGIMIDSGLNIVKKVDGIFIDHPGNINGIYFNIFCANKKLIYSNFYPRGFYCIDKRKGKNKKIKNFLDSRILPSKKGISNKIIEKNKKHLNKLVKDPGKYVVWMKKTNFRSLKSINFKYSKVEHVVYAHSFVDSPLDYGYDGFSNLVDWLEFTIKELKKSNKYAIIKAHPNFYNKMLGEFAENDSKLFAKLKAKYESEKLFFIDFPVKNYLLLKEVPKKTILVSHHGTSLLEGNFMGFKSICSKATFWSPKFNVLNQYTSINHYKNLLNSNWNKLKISSNEKNFYDLSNQVFFNKYGINNSLFWQKFIEKKSKIKLKINEIGIKNFNKKQKIIQNINQNMKHKIFKKISENIEEVII